MELISFFVWSTSFCIVFHRSNNWTSKIVLECMKPLSFAFTAKFPKEFPAKFHPKIVSSKVSPKNVPSKVCPPSLLETESSCFASVNWAWETLMRKCFLMTGSQGLVVTSSDWSAITLHCLWRLRVIKRSPLDINPNVLMSSYLKVQIIWHQPGVAEAPASRWSGDGLLGFLTLTNGSSWTLSPLSGLRPGGGTLV